MVLSCEYSTAPGMGGVIVWSLSSEVSPYVLGPYPILYILCVYGVTLDPLMCVIFSVISTPRPYREPSYTPFALSLK